MYTQKLFYVGKCLLKIFRTLSCMKFSVPKKLYDSFKTGNYPQYGICKADYFGIYAERLYITWHATKNEVV